MTSGNRSNRHIAIFSSGRHDWGYLEPVLRCLAACENVTLSVYRCLRGFTDEQIKEIPAGVKVFQFALLDEGQEICPSVIASVTGGLAELLENSSPDIMVVLGDRTETLAACVVAVSAAVIVAHIHGGDKAPGELDDANRHAITKLSHVHFAATEDAALRIKRLGEQSWRIFLTGSPGIDSIISDGLATSDEAREFVVLNDGKAFVLLVLHPEGRGAAAEISRCEKICQTISTLDISCVCVKPNPDRDSGVIAKVLDKFSSLNNWPILETMPRRIYLRLMADSIALIGNSSSGMIESAAVNAAVVDIGSRQKGRLHSDNVVHIESADELGEVLVKLLEDADLSSQLRNASCIYGDGTAGDKIAECLQNISLGRQTRIKLIDY